MSTINEQRPTSGTKNIKFEVLYQEIKKMCKNLSNYIFD